MSLQSTDPIADLLTRIRNAIQAGHSEITVPASKLKLVIANQLKASGYLADVKVEEAKPRANMIVTINKVGSTATINEISRISTPGRRVYVSANEIPRVKSGRGIVLVSTSKGVLRGDDAKKQRLGGELLLKVY